MEQVTVRLDKAMGTALITFYLKALDARMSPTILGDTIAAQTVEKIDYDFASLKLSPKLAPKVASRSKHFDNWAREFLAAHEGATVVHLGVGLDTRVWRVDPPPGVSWYDVDYPEVIDVRRRLFPDRKNYRMIGSSVTEPDWLRQIPTDSPTLIIGEGLTMYLTPEEGHDLFRRIIEHLPSGTIIFDTQSRLGVRMVNKYLTRTFGVALLHWGINDPRELERLDPRLHCTDVISSMTAPGITLSGGMKILAGLMRCIPATRDLVSYVRYQFG